MKVNWTQVIGAILTAAVIGLGTCAITIRDDVMRLKNDNESSKSGMIDHKTNEAAAFQEIGKRMDKHDASLEKVNDKLDKLIMFERSRRDR
jgi:hypothetical protein